MIDLSKYDGYLEPMGTGLGIKADCPQNIKDELIEIDKEYFDVYGQHLLELTIPCVTAYAKEQGYDDALYIGKWKDYEAYEPTFDGNDVSFVGVPLLILVKDGDIRMSTVEEAFEQLSAYQKLTFES